MSFQEHRISFRSFESSSASCISFMGLSTSVVHFLVRFILSIYFGWCDFKSYCFTFTFPLYFIVGVKKFLYVNHVSYYLADFLDQL